MRGRTLGVGVGVGVGILFGSAAVALGAPVALATTQGGPEVFITGDGSPQAGERIQVIVRCDGEVGTPSSPVLQIGELTQIQSPADIPTYAADATIEAGTAPGDHQVTASCDGAALALTFTVQAPDHGPGEVFIIADGSPQPGERIQVGVRCDGDLGAAVSPVLEIGELGEVRTPSDVRTYVAPATIKRDAKPGDHPLTALCDGETLRTTITVEPGAPGRAGGGQVHRIPHGGLETGGGPADSDGSASLPLAIVGAGVTGLGALTVRRLVRR